MTEEKRFSGVTVAGPKEQQPIDLSHFHVPSWANWLAMNADGEVYPFMDKPYTAAGFMCWMTRDPEGYKSSLGTLDAHGIDWKKTLTPVNIVQAPLDLSRFAVPDWANWVAMDADGEVYAFKYKPQLGSGEWYQLISRPTSVEIASVGHLTLDGMRDMGITDWTRTLTPVSRDSATVAPTATNDRRGFCEEHNAPKTICACGEDNGPASTTPRIESGEQSTGTPLFADMSLHAGDYYVVTHDGNNPFAYETVHGPSHYDHPTIVGLQAIDVIQDFPYNVATAMAYLWRCGRKPGTDPLEDLRKARQHIDFELRRLETAQKGGATWPNV